MHPFGLIGGLLHGTALAVFAFFVWFAAARAHGWLRLFGRMLGFWLVILAIASILFGLLARGPPPYWPPPGAGSARRHEA